MNAPISDQAIREANDLMKKLVRPSTAAPVASTTPPNVATASVQPTVNKPVTFPAHGTAGSTGYAPAGGTTTPHVNAPAPATVNAPAPAQAQAPKTPGKAHRFFQSAEESAATPMGKAAQHSSRKWLGRIALPLTAADIYDEGKEVVNSVDNNEFKTAATRAGGVAGKYGGMLAGAALGAKVGAGIGTFAVPVPFIGTIAGSAGGLLIGGALGLGGYLLGDKVGPAVGSLVATVTGRRDLQSDANKHDLAMKNYLEAAKAEALGGGTPALHQATLGARETYLAARKEAMPSETEAERTTNMKALDANFGTLAKNHATAATAAASAYEKSKNDYKSILTQAVMADDTSKQAAIDAAGVAMFKARRATLEGRAEPIETTKAEVMKFGESTIEAAEKARIAGGAGASTQRLPANPNLPSVAAPETATAPSAPVTRTQVKPVPADVLTPPPPPKKETLVDKITGMTKDIPIIGPIVGAIAGFFGGDDKDPNKKSPLSGLLDWFGDKKGLSGMGMLVTGIAAFAAVANMMDGGIFMGLIAAVAAIAIISNVMKSFGGDTPAPQGQRSPALDGPQQQRTQEVVQQRGLETSGPAPAAALQDAARSANLQSSSNISGNSADVSGPTAPTPGGGPAPAGPAPRLQK